MSILSIWRDFQVLSSIQVPEYPCDAQPQSIVQHSIWRGNTAFLNKKPDVLRSCQTTHILCPENVFCVDIKIFIGKASPAIDKNPVYACKVFFSVVALDLKPNSTANSLLKRDLLKYIGWVEYKLSSLLIVYVNSYLSRT